MAAVRGGLEGAVGEVAGGSDWEGGGRGSRWWEQVEPGELVSFSCHLAAPSGYATQLSPPVWLGRSGRGWV